MPGFPTPSSGGFAEKAPGGSAQSKVPGKAAYGGQSGGQVMISGPEEKALRVLELDDPMDPNDDTQLLQQAAAESGLPIERVQKLQMRAESARNKGMTLKGPTITFQPINPQVEDGLLGDPMADVGGDDELGPDGLGPEMDPAALTLGGNPNDARAPGRNLPPDAQGQVNGGKPLGGPITTGATMSSAGLSNQRMAAPWRAQMSQATLAPPRMNPDLNRPGGAPKPGMGAAPGAAPGVPPPRPGAPTVAAKPGGTVVAGRPDGAMVAAQPGGSVVAKPGYGPARRPVPPSRPMSGGNRFAKTDSRDPRLAAAYAREAVSPVEECDECGGTCGGKKKHRR